MKKYLVLVVIALSIGTILPLFNNGFFVFHDNTQVVRVFEMNNALNQGLFPVRFVENLGYGYGYPIFNFYAPLAYYIGAGIMSLGFDPLSATKAMIGFGMMLSAATMYFLLKKFYGIPAAIVGSVAYAFFPYHALNLYVRGAIGELYAYAFLPIVFLGLFSALKLERNRSYFLKNFREIGLIATGIFLVGVSHNLSLYMLFLFMTLFTLCGLFFSNSKKTFLLTVLIGTVIGIGLTSFYTLPAFLEMSYTNVASQVGGGADFRDHFVCIGQFWNSAWGFGGSIPGCLDGMSFRLGKINVVITLFALLLILYSFNRKKIFNETITLISIILLIFSLFFSTEYSKWLWEVLPGMPFLQYPWRFLNFAGLFISLLAGFIVYFIGLQRKAVGLLAAAILVLALLVTQQKLFNPNSSNDFSSDYYSDKRYIQFTVSKISDEYLPPNFEKPNKVGDLPITDAEIIGSSGTISILENKIDYMKFDYKAAGNGEILIRKAYFPYWKAYINGKEAELRPEKNGMSISYSEKAGVVELKYVQTTIEMIGNLLTIFSFLALFIGIIVKRSEK